MISCTRKNEKKKKVGDHKQISFKFFKKYSIDDVKYEIYNITI